VPSINLKWVFRVVRQLSFHYQYDCGSPTRGAQLEGRPKSGRLRTLFRVVQALFTQKRPSPTAWDEHCEHVPYRAGDRKCRKWLPPNAPAHGFSCIACLDHRFAISILRFSGYLASLLFEHQCNQC
jgi:hypothetical protein